MIEIQIRYRLKRKGDDSLGEISVQIDDIKYRDEDARSDAIDDAVQEKLTEPVLWWRELN